MVTIYLFIITFEGQSNFSNHLGTFEGLFEYDRKYLTLTMWIMRHIARNGHHHRAMVKLERMNLLSNAPSADRI